MTMLMTMLAVALSMIAGAAIVLAAVVLWLDSAFRPFR